MKPKLLILVAGAALASFTLMDQKGGAFPFEGVAFAQAQNQAVPRSQMSEVAFKNIQELKGIPVDEFMGTMGLFSAALSVCCGDCHVGAGTDHPDWAADPPRKKVARRMIAMVNTINKENFNGRQQVTCWTCHRGAQAPAQTPPIDTIYADMPYFVPPDVLPAANPATAGTPPANQILDTFVKALGGADKLANLKSYTAKGTSMLYGEAQADPAEIYAKAPNQLTVIVHQRGGDLARVYDGQNAWVMLPLTVVGEYPLNASARLGAKLDAQLAFPAGLKDAFKNWKVSYPATINGKDVYVLQTTDDGMLATFYFDRKTGLLDRVVHDASSAVGRVPTQIDYSDYRPVAGVMMPHQWTYGWVSGREEYTISEYQPNVPVDASKFAQPVQRPK